MFSFELEEIPACAGMTAFCSDSLVEWRGPHTKLREEAIWCGVSTELKKEVKYASVYLVFK